MPQLSARDIADLVTGTLDDLGRLRFQQIVQDLQDYEIMGRWLKEDRVVVGSGVGIKRTLMLKRGGVAKHTGLFATDDVNISDHLAQLDVPWRQATTSWGFEHREVLMNRGPDLIVNVIKPRRVAAMIDLAQELEDKAWVQVPSSTDTLLPFSIPFWIVANATTGFNGGAPSGHTTVAGINPTTYPNFKNYTAQYTNVTKADLISKMRTAQRKIGFKSPVTVNDFRGGKGDRYRIYVNDPTITSLEDIGESQNENLGKDIASIDGGQLVFRRHPIRWVAGLDNEAKNPIYMIDHSVFHPVVLKGDDLRESEPRQAPKQHNTFEVFVDLSYNFVCVDRRRCARLETA